MSHSKKTKRGSSLYVESWNPSAKRFITECVLCGKRGYDPSIEDEGFVRPSEGVYDGEHAAIRAELMKILPPLELDELGRCEVCRRLTEK